jgi:hypothetical protein
MARPIPADGVVGMIDWRRPTKRSGTGSSAESTATAHRIGVETPNLFRAQV